jgi:hypoxanthine phosphoribosyltransferase
LGLAENLDILYTAEQIHARVRELGAQIARDYAGHELMLVCVLKGSAFFLADLARAIDLPLTIDFIGASSYGANTETSGVVRITTDLSKPIEGKDVLVVEDIVDTGLTMAYLLENLATRHPRSVKLCSLLHKPARARTKIDIHYLGFTIPDEFVVGYGLDFGEKYRNVPFVGVMRK